MKIINSKPTSFLHKVFRLMLTKKGVLFITNADFLVNGIVDGYIYEDENYNYKIKATNKTLVMSAFTKDIQPKRAKEITYKIQNNSSRAIAALKEFISE